MPTDSTFLAAFFRHGTTWYRQGNAPRLIDEADDLAKDAEVAIAQNCARLAASLDKDKPLAIRSSCTGRCLHTARIIRDTFAALGFTVQPIVVWNSLREVENFEWDFFHALVKGGELDFDGEEVVIDASLTNPGNFSTSDYFREDGMHCLSEPAKASLPLALLQKIECVEKASSVRKRIGHAIGCMQMPVGTATTSQAIFVTHDALVQPLVEHFTDGAQGTLERGNYVLLRGNVTEVRICEVAGVTEGQHDGY